MSTEAVIALAFFLAVGLVPVVLVQRARRR